MDTTDPEIEFFGADGCNHCMNMRKTKNLEWFVDDSGSEYRNLQISKIKKYGQGKEYDSILGLSGGADSSYLALKAFDWGLRPLVVHVDAGWNSELAVSNIQAILDFTGWDIYTKVINWPEIRDLQLAYLRSGVSNQDVPQDHAFFTHLYEYAISHDIKYILSGGNTATEGIFPSSWHDGAAMDAISLKAINQAYGSSKLKFYNTTSFLKYYFYFPFVKKMSPVRPLNWIPYNKSEAMRELQERTGWTPYKNKHGESVFTRFFQEYFLPTRFGIDKRIPHLSSQIVSEQTTREQAIAQLDEPLYRPGELLRDIDYICRKLRISQEEFESFMAAPIHSFKDFPNWNKRRELVKKMQLIAGLILRKKITVYS
jgi:N-acetyl sugar amidotransferase